MNFKKLSKSLKKSKRCLLAVLVDPDKFNIELIKAANKSKADCFLVGGSILQKGKISETILAIKKITKIPVVLFPGDENQLDKNADGLFLPSLVSGRNADYLIEKQILMAPKIKQMKLKHLPMAYLLIEGNSISSTQKITKTRPLKNKDEDKILNTVLAAEYLGFKLIYLEAGSGAKQGVSAALIKKVKLQTKLPLIVGGGINTIHKAKTAIGAGANMVVVGNALEKNPNLIFKLSSAFKTKNTTKFK